MIREKLISRLKSIGRSDIEFNDAAWSVPKDALSTLTKVGVKLKLWCEQLAEKSEEGNGY